MKLAHLTFHPHILRDEVARIRKLIATEPSMKNMRDYVMMAETAVQASCEFANGWSLSIITADTRPGAEGLNRLFYASKQDGTYEVMAFGPNGESQGPFAWQTAEQVDALLARFASYETQGKIQ